MGYPEGREPTTSTVRVSKKLLEAIDEFLGTETGTKLGLNYKKDLVTLAVQEFLVKYGFLKVREEDKDDKKGEKRYEIVDGERKRLGLIVYDRDLFIENVDVKKTKDILKNALRESGYDIKCR